MLAVSFALGCSGATSRDAGPDALGAPPLLCDAPVEDPVGLVCFSPLVWLFGARNTQIAPPCFACAEQSCAAEARDAFGPLGIRVTPEEAGGDCAALLECAATCACGEVECFEDCRRRTSCSAMNRLINCLRDAGCDEQCLVIGGRCGDGIIQADEQCEPSLPAGSCRQIGMSDGALGCTTTCRWQRRDCLASCCGDGRIDRGEQCDGEALDGVSCGALGYEGGALACDDTCRRDASSCVGDGGRCGDGFASETLDEICDVGDIALGTCADIGYASGEIACGAECQSYDFSGCTPRALGSGGACAAPIVAPTTVEVDGYTHFWGTTVGGSRLETASCGGGDGVEIVFEITFPGSSEAGAVLVTAQSGQLLSGVTTYLRETCDATTEVACARGGTPLVAGPLSPSRRYLLFVDTDQPTEAFEVTVGSL